MRSPTARCPEISIIIPNWNTRGPLADCLESVTQATTDLDIETVVVDNASTDGSHTMVGGRFPRVGLIRNRDNLGFARAINQGAAATAGRYLLLLNSDARLQSGCVRAMFDLAEQQPRIGVVGARLRNADGSFQASHASFPTLGQEFLVLSGLGRAFHGPWYPSRGPADAHGAERVDWVSGACVLVRRHAFAAVGGLDEGYVFYAEEMDLCYRMHQAGWEVWYEPAAHVIHLGGASSRHRPIEREAELYCSRVRFFRKHRSLLAARLLGLQMCAFTAIKRPVHAVLSALSGGRCGRPVIPLRVLARRLWTET